MTLLAPGEPQAPSAEELHDRLSQFRGISEMLLTDLEETIDQGTNFQRLLVQNILQEISVGDKFPTFLVSQLERYS